MKKLKHPRPSPKRETSDEDNVESARQRSSDDDVPLSSLAVRNEVQNIMPHPIIYKTIYGSSDSESEELQATTNNKENYRQTCKSPLNEAVETQPSTSNNDDSNLAEIRVKLSLHNSLNF